MVESYSRYFLKNEATYCTVLLCILLLISACNQDEGNTCELPTTSVSKLQAPQSNATDEVCIEQSEDYKSAIEMRSFLDDGDTDKAFILARKLMTSDEEIVLSEVITTLGWIGRRAIPELAELMQSKNETVRTEALLAWENVVDEIDSDNRKALIVTESIRGQVYEPIISAILLKLTFIDQKIALRALDCIQRETQRGIISRCVDDMYNFISDEDN